MNITIRKSEERGHANHGWLNSKHTFSFADYYDPAHMGYRTLRVINDDRVAAKQGFGTHPHSNMEIFSYVISGQLQHEDSMGNGRVIQAGEFQYMSAGAGVYHSEFNPGEEEAHFLQIWIQPNQKGGAPKYAELDTKALSSQDGLTLFASSDGREGSVQMRQEAEIYFGKAPAGQTLTVPASALDGVWIHLISGALTIDGHTIHPGDSLSIDDAQDGFPLSVDQDAEFILFRLQ